MPGGTESKISVDDQFPTPIPGIGIAFRRTDLPFGLDFVTTSLSTHEFPRHVHEGYTLGLVRRGCFEYWVRGTVRVCPTGSLILMNPGEVHTGRARAGFGVVSYEVIYPRAELVERLVGRAPPLVRFESVEPDLVRQFRRLSRLAGSRGPAGEEVLASVLEAFVSSLSRCADAGDTRRRQLTRLVQQFLQRNLRARPTLDDLGPRIGLHPAYLRRIFRLETGLSPRSYLVQLRVMRARQLLGKGAPIAEAVSAAGFADQAHLTHAFRRTMGFAPRQFQHELGYR